ncbi:hypothetical protein [Streptomyces clavifer]|uniref:hypothetical protein n=1 Tax=Streptomyces clavifer TaxID=68188 RepID=UPI0036CF68DE
MTARTRHSHELSWADTATLRPLILAGVWHRAGQTLSRTTWSSSVRRRQKVSSDSWAAVVAPAKSDYQW